MIEIMELKRRLEKLGYRVIEEKTNGNYDKSGELIKESVPTLTTKYCEIGFYLNAVYFVFIARSDSWSQNLYGVLKKIPNIEIYGHKDFHKNYKLSDNIEIYIKNEPYFQLQFNYNLSKVSVEQLVTFHENIVHKLLKNNATIVNQLEKHD